MKRDTRPLVPFRWNPRTGAEEYCDIHGNPVPHGAEVRYVFDYIGGLAGSHRFCLGQPESERCPWAHVDPTRVYKPAQAAAVLARVSRLGRMCPKTVTRMLASGELPGFTTPGGHRRVYGAQLIEYIAQQTGWKPPRFHTVDPLPTAAAIQDEPALDLEFTDLAENDTDAAAPVVVPRANRKG